MFYWCAMLFILILAGFWSFYKVQILQAKHTSKPFPPGPPTLPIIGHLHMLGDLPHRTLHNLSQIYGPIMGIRLGTVPTIVVSSPEAAEMFLKTHDMNFASRPKIQAADYLSYGGKGLVFSEYGPYWRNLRKLCTMHLLSNSKTESYESLRKEEVWTLVDRLKGGGHEAVNISAQVQSVVERISYGMIFGKGYQEKFNIKACAQDALQLVGRFNIADYIPFMKAFDIQRFAIRAKSINKFMDDILEQIICEHETNKEHQMDFIYDMLSIGEKLDRVTIKAITLDMLAAALETSATTIEWALTELVRHPQVMKRVQDELVDVVGLHRAVEESDLPKLTYFHMVVKEAMRIHPVAPLLIPRESIEDISIGGFHIPKKSRIIINAWAIGRDPNSWPNNPEIFYPERFNSTEVDVRGHDTQLIPFGSGRRKCPGMELGIRTVHFVLAQLMHCFDLELPNGVSPEDVDTKEKFGLAVPRAKPLYLVPVSRLHVNNF